MQLLGKFFEKFVLKSVKICYAGHNILDFCNILEKFGFTTSKGVVDIYHKNISYELLLKLPNNVGLKILGK